MSQNTEKMSQKFIKSQTKRCVKKQCPTGKVLNANTGRCVKSKKSTRSKVKKPEKKNLSKKLNTKLTCPDGYIVRNAYIRELIHELMALKLQGN